MEEGIVVVVVIVEGTDADVDVVLLSNDDDVDVVGAIVSIYITNGIKNERPVNTLLIFL